MRARIELTGTERDAGRRKGWRISPGSDSTTPMVHACVTADGTAVLEVRREKSAGVEQVPLALKGADVLQLERRGNSFFFSAARSGEPFVAAAPVEIDLGDDVEVGLFVGSHNQSDESPSIFRDVRISKPAKVGFRPYQDYIGARLEILDVHSGRLDVVHSATEPFEAPNWMLDGRTIIVNVGGAGANKGLLRTFDLETGKVAPLETAFAIHNNNDHVLSFDGSQLAISHHSPDDDGRSVVYTLPSTGGTPQRITPKSPSFLHGWSPDSRWLVYTGGRKTTAAGPDSYDIYKIPAAGGEEIRLTSAPGLNDGPEYSPDGKYIYFNSTRSGLMQLWRMKPDGSQQEQVTNDGFNNWFPHVSPDGKWIVFLSFGQDVRPDDHPYYKHVYIRLMPAAGGPARVIAYVYGGQGTINVPSWSPDSRRIAFVSNTDEF